MQTTDGQILTVTIGRYLADPGVPTINLPDRFIPVMNPSNLADAFERLLQAGDGQVETFANLKLQRENGCTILSILTLDSEEENPGYCLDAHNAGRLVSELRNIAGLSDTASMTAFVEEAHS
jgi:hypothetical protein